MEEGYLTIASNAEGPLAKFNSKELSKFVEQLCKGAFPVNISKEIFLFRDKFVFREKEEPLESKNIDQLFEKLIKCLPFLLMSGSLESHVYVCAVRAFVIFLAEKVSVPDGEQCLKNLQSGVHDQLLTNFYATPFGKAKSLPGFFFFHCNVIQNIWLLRTSLWKKSQSQRKKVTLTTAASSDLLLNYTSHPSTEVSSNSNGFRSITNAAGDKLLLWPMHVAVLA